VHEPHFSRWFFKGQHVASRERPHLSREWYDREPFASAIEGPEPPNVTIRREFWNLERLPCSLVRTLWEQIFVYFSNYIFNFSLGDVSSPVSINPNFNPKNWSPYPTQTFKTHIGLFTSYPVPLLVCPFFLSLYY
jgi:hypothetical protein